MIDYPPTHPVPLPVTYMGNGCFELSQCTAVPAPPLVLLRRQGASRLVTQRKQHPVYSWGHPAPVVDPTPYMKLGVSLCVFFTHAFTNINELFWINYASIHIQKHVMCKYCFILSKTIAIYGSAAPSLPDSSSGPPQARLSATSTLTQPRDLCRCCLPAPTKPAPVRACRKLLIWSESRTAHRADSG